MASAKEKLSELTVPELQKELKSRGLKRSGVKAKLVERLYEAVNAENFAGSEQGSFTTSPSNKQHTFQGSPSLQQSAMLNLPQIQAQTLHQSSQQDALQMFLSQQQHSQSQQLTPVDQQQQQYYQPQLVGQYQLPPQQDLQQATVLPSVSQLLSGQLLQTHSYPVQSTAAQQQQQVHMLQQQVEHQQLQHSLLLPQQINPPHQVDDKPYEASLQKAVSDEKSMSSKHHQHALLEQQEMQQRQNIAVQQQEAHQLCLLQEQRDQERQISEQQHKDEEQRKLLEEQARCREQEQLLIEREIQQNEQDRLEKETLQNQQVLHRLQQKNEEEKQRLCGLEGRENEEQTADWAHEQQQIQEQQQIMLQEQQCDTKLQDQEENKNTTVYDFDTDATQKKMQDEAIPGMVRDTESSEMQIVCEAPNVEYDKLDPHLDKLLVSGGPDAMGEKVLQEEPILPATTNEIGLHVSDLTQEKAACLDQSEAITDDGMSVDVQPSEEERKVAADTYTPAPSRKERKPKPSTPVQIKKRKTEQGTAEKPSRKRRWGSVSSQSSITIDTDAIKDLIPAEIASQALVKKQEQFEKEETENRDPLMEISDVNPQHDEECSLPLHSNVQVIDAPDKADVPDEQSEEDDGSEVHVSDAGARGEGQGIALPPNVHSKPHEAVTGLVTRKAGVDHRVVSMDEGIGGVRVRDPRNPVNPVNRVVHIENLVRPFTLRQLKELLQQSGTLVEDGFWINKIKSFCFATFLSDEEAISCQHALDGIKWPVGSPKVLRADFATLDKLHTMTDGALGEKLEAPPKKKEKDQGARIKVDQRAPFQEIDKSRRMSKEDSPARLLDDLFRKTKAKPCLYWLPLTEEQVQEKEKAREERKEARQMQPEDATNRDRGKLTTAEQPRHTHSQQTSNRSSPQKKHEGRNYRRRSRSRSPSPVRSTTNRRDSFRR